MNSRLIVVGLLIAAGIAVLALLITPVVHLPYIVVHGPMSALRAQRAAALFKALLSACASLFVGLVFAIREMRKAAARGSTPFEVSDPLDLSCALRC